MKRFTLLAALLACGHAASPAPASAPQRPPGAATPWQLELGVHEICMTRGAKVFCVSPAEKEVVSKPRVPRQRGDGSHWTIGADGHVSAVPNEPVHETESETGEARRSLTEDKLRAHVANEVPPITKLVHSDMAACGLTISNRDVVCWSEPFPCRTSPRDPCPNSKPWRTQRVAGVPKDLASLSLADNDGYALDRAGNVYTWARAADECNAPAPTARLLASGVHAVLAGEFVKYNEPSFGPLACAAMNGGSVQCWRTPKDTPSTVPL